MEVTPTLRLPATYKVDKGVLTSDVYFETHSPGPLRGFETLVSEADVRRWAGIFRDESSWYQGNSPWGMPIAPPTILYYASQNLMGSEFHSGGGFARYTTEFVGPIPIGRPLSIEGAVEDKFVRRGRGYVVWTMIACAGDAIVQRSRKSWSFRLTPDQAGDWPERAGEERPAIVDTPVEVLQPIEHTITLDQMVSFEGPNQDNAHTNPAIARAGGFAAPLAQGALSHGLLFRLVRDRFKEGFTVGGTLDVRFIRPVLAGQKVVARGEVTRIQGGSASCRVHVESDSGDVLSTGFATATILE